MKAMFISVAKSIVLCEDVLFMSFMMFWEMVVKVVFMNLC